MNLENLKVEFSEVNHKYKKDDSEILSVTQILKHIGIIPDYPEVSRINEARDRGKAVHKLLELLCDGYNTDEIVDLYNAWIEKEDNKTPWRQVRGYLISGQIFLNEEITNKAILRSEVRIGNELYGGTVDLLVNDRFIIDWKTSSKIKDEDYLQLAAYCYLLEIRESYIVQLTNENYIKYKTPDMYYEIWEKILCMYLNKNDKADIYREYRKLIKRQIKIDEHSARQLVELTLRHEEIKKEIERTREAVDQSLNIDGIQLNGFIELDGEYWDYNKSKSSIRTKVDIKKIIEHFNGLYGEFLTIPRVLEVIDQYTTTTIIDGSYRLTKKTKRKKRDEGKQKK